MIGESRYGEYNVVAAFENMDAARLAMRALEGHGFEGATLSLTGRGAKAVAGTTDTSYRDARVVRNVGFRALVFGAAGAIPGAGIGFVVGYLIFASASLFAWAATLAGAVGGGAVGMALAGVSTMEMNKDWELTYEDVGSKQVLVGVHADDRDYIERAFEVLERQKPIRLERLDRRGRPLRAA